MALDIEAAYNVDEAAGISQKAGAGARQAWISPATPTRGATVSAGGGRELGAATSVTQRLMTGPARPIQPPVARLHALSRDSWRNGLTPRFGALHLFEAILKRRDSLAKAGVMPGPESL